ncbi:MAG: hypothetical protein ACTH5U_08610, partial [Pseudomonadales bacterium]
WFLSRELVSATHPLHLTIQDIYKISINIVLMLTIRLMSWASIITKPKRIASVVYRFNAAFIKIIDTSTYIAFLYGKLRHIIAKYSDQTAY